MNVKNIDSINIVPSQSRVLFRPFIPNNERIKNILSRIFSLSEKEGNLIINNIKKEYNTEQFNIEKILLTNFNLIEKFISHDSEIPYNKKLLIGSFFTQKYALESAALCNPSIIEHPNQSGLKKGELRFILSLRAIGEGHVSSIVFREGVIKNNKISLNEAASFLIEPIKNPNPFFIKNLFTRKLIELGIWNDISKNIIEPLSESFTLESLLNSITKFIRENTYFTDIHITIDAIKTLAFSNYEVVFDSYTSISERVIFPSSPTEINGIEDARFVKFIDDDKTIKYLATYTAYDGKIIFPQLLETSDFISFRFLTLNGEAAKNKGMALFPRKINGLYTMLSRQDNENLFVVFSDNLHFWFDPIKIIRPRFTWEFIQIGNCGSPIEIEEGWLVLSHGVGPMRKYCIGAFLLDKKNPSKVIGRLKNPIIEPKKNNKQGYVPNVVYTCGGLVFNNKLILPYSMFDYSTTFAIIDIKDILDEIV